jgi:hypothetical protein
VSRLAAAIVLRSSISHGYPCKHHKRLLWWRHCWNLPRTFLISYFHFVFVSRIVLPDAKCLLETTRLLHLSRVQFRNTATKCLGFRDLRLACPCVGGLSTLHSCMTRSCGPGNSRGFRPFESRCSKCCCITPNVIFPKWCLSGFPANHLNARLSLSLSLALNFFFSGFNFLRESDIKQTNDKSKITTICSYSSGLPCHSLNVIEIFVFRQHSSTWR